MICTERRERCALRVSTFNFTGRWARCRQSRIRSRRTIERRGKGRRRCVYLGHVQDMPALMATADMVVLPSYREGVPRGLIEAAAAGFAHRDDRCSRVPGGRGGRVNGILVPTRDSVSLAAAIRKIVLDGALAARMGAASRQESARPV